MVLIGQKRKLLQELNLPDHAKEVGTSADLLSLRRSRLNILRRQKAEDTPGKPNLLGDRQPLADELAGVELKIGTAERIAARVWQDIEVLDSQIAALEASSVEVSDSTLVVS